MSETTLDEESGADGGDGTGAVTLSVDGEDVVVGVPSDADRAETAAIASAVGAHLHDRAVAAAATAESEPEQVDEWKLAGRLKSVGRRRWPSDVRKGEEWKAAARSQY